LESEAKAVLLETLRRVPAVRVEGDSPIVRESRPMTSSPGQPDIVLALQTPAGSRTIIVEVKSSGEPRWARSAVNSLLRARQGIPGAYAVFMAPYISPAAAQVCLADDVGYLDLAGNCRIAFDHVYIERTVETNRPSRRHLRSLYSPKAERVLRVLLNYGQREWAELPGPSWRYKNLAQEAGVSIGHVSNVQRQLADRELITRTDTGWVLSNPEALLKEWTDNYDPRRNRTRHFYSVQSPQQTELMLQKVCEERGQPFAFTGFSASARWAPTVLHQKVSLYVDKVDDLVPRVPSLREVERGANVELIEPYDAGVYYASRSRRDIETVSVIQVYLDVSREKVRGPDAAHALLDYIRASVWRKEQGKPDGLP
jgi:hypothetical protein